MSVGYKAYSDAEAASSSDASNPVLEHVGLVHRIALHLKARLPDNVELDELIQIGMVGLLEASKAYNPDVGVDLAAFASKRIKGAILDEVRKRSPLSRTDSSRAKAEKGAADKLAKQLGREPTVSELAKEMKVTNSDIHDARNRAHTYQTVSIDDLSAQGRDFISGEDDPESQTEDLQAKEWLIGQIQRLPVREQTILSLYYNEELNLKEIGAVVGITESRVSQIITQVVSKLRKRIVD